MGKLFYVAKFWFVSVGLEFIRAKMFFAAVMTLSFLLQVVL
jgi:hypothetical protein